MSAEPPPKHPNYIDPDDEWERIERQQRPLRIGCLIVFILLLVIPASLSFWTGHPWLGAGFLLPLLLLPYLWIHPWVMRTFFGMKPDVPPATPTGRAYRQAGHATMSYLARFGYITDYVPILRGNFAPAFAAISVDGENPKWSRITPNLGSMLVTAQVLMAGYVAEQLQAGTLPEPEPPRLEPLIRSARHYIGAYIEEMGVNNLGDRDKETAVLMPELYGTVVKRIRVFWPQVEALATALLSAQTLTEAEAFAVLEASMPAEAKAAAQAVLNRDHQRDLRDHIQRLIEDRDQAKSKPKE